MVEDARQGTHRRRHTICEACGAASAKHRRTTDQEPHKRVVLHHLAAVKEATSAKSGRWDRSRCDKDTSRGESRQWASLSSRRPEQLASNSSNRVVRKRKSSLAGRDSLKVSEPSHRFSRLQHARTAPFFGKICAIIIDVGKRSLIACLVHIDRGSRTMSWTTGRGPWFRSGAFLLTTWVPQGRVGNRATL